MDLMTRKPHTEETKRLISQNRKGKCLGHPFWGNLEALQAAGRHSAELRRKVRSLINCGNSKCINTFLENGKQLNKKYCSIACARVVDKVVTPIEIRFWSKVSKGNPEDCWLWTAALTKSGGYGQISLSRKEGPARAHRVSYKLANGTIADPEMCVLHTCDTPACVNPAHLFLGTKDDNAKDMSSKQRWKNHVAQGENHIPFNGHLT